MAKRASPAQVRARRLFAQRARAGTLRKGSKLRAKARAAVAKVRRSRPMGRARNFFKGRKGQFKPAINGAIGGVAASYGARFIGPEYGPSVGLGVAGYMQNDPILMELAGIQLGARLASSLPGSMAGGSADVL